MSSVNATTTLARGKMIATSLILVGTLAMLLVTVESMAQAPSNPRVDHLFAEWDKHDTPGCAVGVVQNGRFLYKHGYGMANLDNGIPNAPEMLYYVGSVSKQFTAATVGLLSLEGRISLDDDIRKYFPEMPNYGTPIRIRHLIHHTSGIADIYELMELNGVRTENPFSDSAAIALIVSQETLAFQPGAKHEYSNSGYFLLGQLVKRVTGKSLREYADERIFKPLGMTQTHFHDNPQHVVEQRAESYEPNKDGSYRVAYLPNHTMAGAGGLYTTLGDLLKWDENYYTKQVGGDALQRLIHTRGVLNNGDTLRYAFGNYVDEYRGLRRVVHGGSYMGYQAYFLRFPDQHFSVLLTCNLGTIDRGPLAHAVAELYLDGKMMPEPSITVSEILIVLLVIAGAAVLIVGLRRNWQKTQ